MSLSPSLLHGVYADEVARWLLSTVEGAEGLLSGDGVSDEVWIEFYPAKPLPAADLVTRHMLRGLNDRRASHVASVETRAAVLKDFFQYWEPDLDDVKTIMEGKGFTKATAARIFGFAWIDDVEVKDRCARRAGGTTLLHWYAYGPTVDVDEIRTALVELEVTFGAKKLSKDELNLLIHRYPSVVADLAGAEHIDARLVPHLAGCRHLTDTSLQLRLAENDPALGSTDDWVWRMMRLVNNPVVGEEVFESVLATLPGVAHQKSYDIKGSIDNRRASGRVRVTETYEEVSDAAILGWLTNRAAPFEDRYTGNVNPGRPWDSEALARNPHLNGPQAAKVAASLVTSFASDQLGELWMPAATALLERHSDVDDPQFDRLRTVVDDTLNPRPYIPPPPGKPVERPVASDDEILAKRYNSLAMQDLRRFVEIVHDELGTDIAKWETFVSFAGEMWSQTAGDILSLTKRLS